MQQQLKCIAIALPFMEIVIGILQNDEYASHSQAVTLATDNKITYFALIIIHIRNTKCCLVETNGSYKAEWNGEAYMVCENCKQVLKPVPLKSKQESDLEKELNIQRIQQQIELEAIQHKQRMQHLQTLLLS